MPEGPAATRRFSAASKISARAEAASSRRGRAFFVLRGALTPQDLPHRGGQDKPSIAAPPSDTSRENLARRELLTKLSAVC